MRGYEFFFVGFFINFVVVSVVVDWVVVIDVFINWIISISSEESCSEVVVEFEVVYVFFYIIEVVVFW